MKRQKRVSSSKKNQQAGSSEPAEAPSNAPGKTPAKAPGKKKSRREFLSTVANVALITAASGGAGWYLIDEVCATTRENDLTRIGNGIPAVVQIHDPECPRCRALQAEARDAMSNFNENDLQYLVANIRLDKGRQLANKHRVGHVTLLLFDGKGRRRGILSGPSTSDYLETAFRNLLPRSSRK